MPAVLQGMQMGVITIIDSILTGAGRDKKECQGSLCWDFLVSHITKVSFSYIYPILLKIATR